MNNLTIERATELFPYLGKLNETDLMQFFMDITKFVLLGPKNEGNDEHILNGLTTFMKYSFENRKLG